MSAFLMKSLQGRDAHSGRLRSVGIFSRRQRQHNLPLQCYMLVLSRRLGESVVIGGKILVRVISIDHYGIKLGITAPPEVEVHRGEVFLRIHGQPPLAAIRDRPVAALSRGVAAPGSAAASVS